MKKKRERQTGKLAICNNVRTNYGGYPACVFLCEIRITARGER